VKDAANGVYDPVFNEGNASLGRMVAIEGAFNDDGIGRYVSNAGDIDGDGVNDILISTGYADPKGREGAGQFYLIFGETLVFERNDDGHLPLSVLTPKQGVRIMGPVEKGYLNVAKSVGDVDGDGHDDIMLAASGADPLGRYNAGEVYILSGALLTQESEEDGVIDLAEFWEA